MTVDAALMKWEGYKKKIIEDVFRIGEHEYIRLSLKYGGVDEDEFISFVYESLFIEYREQLVEEAVERGDHLMYGMSKVDFIVKSYEEIPDDTALNPYIRQSEFREAVALYINQNQLMIHTYCDVENSPITGVW